jgi:acyl-CoA reductase-like NAD-dependent aldehyde dehydrogenase
VGKAGEAAQAIAEMAQFLDREALELKLRRELGSLRPFLPVRTQYSDSIFEAWAPLGLLVHVAPSNAASVAPLSVIEGLLSGNLNFLKTSGSESHLPMLFLDGFLKCDASGSLKNFVIAAQIPSHKREWLKLVFDEADAISAWGGEEAMAQIRSMAPAGARVLEWGHKISFVYATAAGLRDPAVLEKIAQECFWMEQQSCSSPQCVYLEGASKEEIEDWATRLANAFKKVAPRARLAPSLAESGEITMTTELAREEACLGLGQVIESPARDWRILVDTRPQLAASPQAHHAPRDPARAEADARLPPKRGSRLRFERDRGHSLTAHSCGRAPHPKDRRDD